MYVPLDTRSTQLEVLQPRAVKVDWNKNGRVTALHKSKPELPVMKNIKKDFTASVEIDYLAFVYIYLNAREFSSLQFDHFGQGKKEDKTSATTLFVLLFLLLLLLRSFLSAIVYFYLHTSSLRNGV